MNHMKKIVTSGASCRIEKFEELEENMSYMKKFSNEYLTSEKLPYINHLKLLTRR
ncbi:hypothetical protein IFR13_27170 [Bacillus megaterium]|nr:hypothetical protein [Priestia megaterium]